MKNDCEIQERISTLMDGESARPDEDKMLVQSDAALVEQQRQYQEIGRLMRILPEPEPSPHFVEKTLAKLPRNSPLQNGHLYLSLAAAAAVVVAIATVLYQFAPSSPYDASDMPQSIAADAETPLLYLDAPEDALTLLTPDTFATEGLGHVMAAFDEVSVDLLLVALAEMTVEGYLFQPALTDSFIPQSAALEDWLPGAAGSFSDIFLLLETLNHAEVDALNNFLRDAMA